MERRDFLKRGSLALTAPLWTAAAGCASVGSSPALDTRERIGISSVSFRDWFVTTRPATAPAGPRSLDALSAPQFVAQELGIRKLELWNRHFDEPTVAYARRVREAADRAGVQINCVQLPGDMSNPEAAVRDRSIAETRRWIEIAAAAGAPAVRVDTGGGANVPFDVRVTGESYRELAQHGASNNVIILVENHGGHSNVAENVAAIVKHVNSRWVRSYPDFGNMPHDSTARQIAFLNTILPWAHMISAKAEVFDASYRHTSFDIAPLVDAAEAGGFRGVYSIELWTARTPPADPVRATRVVMDTIESRLRAIHSSSTR
ncbi:MAG: sugar phosphate isomerase/epimerase [Gemmatimonadetes bacterium]|nr:sugar phosphate isomerase/epimerase [Gemmatimonadota bacterium]